jgi:hypothetical protein
MTKIKKKKIDRHCNFCGQDGYLESKCFKKMEASEATMKNHNINLDYSSSHGHAFSASVFSFNATSTSSSNEWLIDSGASYHMAKDKAIFSALNECNTKQIFFGDDRSLSVVGFCCRFYTHLLTWRSLQPTWCVLRGTSLSPNPLSPRSRPLPSRLTPREAKGGRPYFTKLSFNK